MASLPAVARRVRDELSYYRALAADPETPAWSRWLLGVAVLYLVSPVDLIPDWIPLIGQLDDLVIVPLLLWAALRSIPLSVRQRVRDEIAVASAADEC